MNSWPAPIQLPVFIVVCLHSWTQLHAGVTIEDGSASAGTDPATWLSDSSDLGSPLDSWFVDIETGYSWKVGGDTPLNYSFASASVSLRTPAHIRLDLDSGDHLVVRAQFSLFGDFFVDGPENHYFAFSAAPSLEYWRQDFQTSFFLSVGGGLGVIDSTDVPGGQGQDLTFNWFAKAGLRRKLTETTYLSAGAMFQHISNTGLTDPNPGLNTLGPFLGLSVQF